MSRADGGSAFPLLEREWSDDGYRYSMAGGMTLRDYFAAKAPAPDADWIDTQQRLDRQKNPYNDSHKPQHRSVYEIDASFRYKWADAMLAERAK